MLNLYTVFHLNLAYSSIEEEQRPEVIQNCYWPLLRLSGKYNLPFGIEATGYTLEAIAAIDTAWIEELRRLTTEGPCEFVGSGYAQLIGPLVPSEVNAANLRLGHQVYERLLGFSPNIALINEQAYSAGLVQHYLDAGYKAIIMEWDNPARYHPEWKKEWRYLPQSACGQHGEKIPLIWNKSISFQKFQRYAHGDMPLDEYMDYLCRHVSEMPRAFSLYGNDAEIFDFRPGRFRTEAALSEESEWQRIGFLFKKLLADGRFRLVRPFELLELLKLHGAGNELRLESPESPVPVKKQGKYNITRWAVTGRNDLAINTECRRIYKKLLELQNAPDDDWRELCYLWSSDFRTHITEKRWKPYIRRLEFFSQKHGVAKNLESGIDVERMPVKSSESMSVVKREGRVLRIHSDRIRLVLDCARGLAIRELCFSDGGTIPHIVTIPHGYFDDISFGADWYSGHFIHESLGQPKVTDLCNIQPEIRQDDGNLSVSGRIDTLLGPLYKTVFISQGEPSLTYQYRMEWKTIPMGSVRLGHITLNPEAFDRFSLFYRSCNGGKNPETFLLHGHKVIHGSPVSFMVSAEGGIGMTGGWVEIGDKNNCLRIETDMTGAAVIGMITYQEIDSKYFCRISFSAGEMDETAKKGPADRIDSFSISGFAFRISAV